MENSQIRIGIIHAYPSAYLIETLKATGSHIVLFVASPLTFDASDLEAVVEVPLHQPEKVIQTVVNYHQEKPFDVLLPIYEGATALTAYAVEGLGLPGVKVSGAAASRNKYLAYQKWSSKGIPVPLTVAIHDPKQGWKEIESHIGYPSGSDVEINVMFLRVVITSGGMRRRKHMLLKFQRSDMFNVVLVSFV